MIEEAGPEFKKACKLYKKRYLTANPDLAAIFPAGNLRFNKVIVTMTQFCAHKSVPELIKTMISSILDLMVDHNLKSILIPVFASRVAGIPKQTCFEFIFEAIKQYLDEHQDKIKDKRIVLNSFEYIYLDEDIPPTKKHSIDLLSTSSPKEESKTTSPQPPKPTKFPKSPKKPRLPKPSPCKPPNPKISKTFKTSKIFKIAKKSYHHTLSSNSSDSSFSSSEEGVILR